MTRQLTTLEGHAQQTRRELETNSQSLQGYLRHLGCQVIAKLTFLTQTTLAIKNSTSQIASTVASISSELTSFRLLLTTLSRPPPMDEYFTIEDAIGRVFPIPLRTITSWDAFAFVLSEKFRGGRGARRVRDGQYQLLNPATRREIKQEDNWEGAFIPHQKIVMSLFCRSPKAATTCPQCQTQSNSDTSVQVQW